ncbi:Predicted nucleic acid-binding protein, contains PIN domain [Quadrisphaera granulorum]|uniref:Ribonuclease VapC n=1 Tax=Quadrisphaera granulorum TaxID=317664 RepID=A0A316ASJ4_9ACTN|nr:type II toxin-antitoxin system VapC family toxin [Quadrisphaera granulorum]PWJ53067.1 putative nucleic acid-binding protein [Quadrisphaera granulorum]SZE97232.1 Predicted nucleic acid-binding protein, contains PIN domain [Quadrisphaera granulorum]
MSLVVCDASALVAVLIGADGADGGIDRGAWAAEQLLGARLAGPALLPFEVSNVIRRLELSGAASADVTAQAHADLMALPVQLFPYEVLAARTRELRATITSYDASYVATAELLGAPLVTLDVRLSRAPGPRCEFRMPV